MAPMVHEQLSLSPSVDTEHMGKPRKTGIALPSGANRLHGGYSHGLSRTWQVKQRLTKDAFVYPLFISDKMEDEFPIASMPGQYRLGISKLKQHLQPLVEMGLRSVILFGVINDDADKDEYGSLADDINGPVISATRLIQSEFPDLYIMCDLCLCEYTSHGHCGILHKNGSLDNTASLERLVSVAQSYAKAGAHCIAPSDMNDGRIGSIKKGLIDIDFAHCVSIMSYAAKFHSSMYGPFRDAAASAPAFGDRRCYQLPCGARGLAKRAIRRDVDEGADFIMVKPAGNYLDIIRDAAEIVPDVTIAAYQVSGEFSTLHASARAGVADLKSLAFESCEAIMRSGASIIISYFTPDFLGWLNF